jgi:DNA-binding NtrC family response regulator
MATETLNYGVLIIASEEIGKAAEKALNAAGRLTAKSVTGARPALAAIGSAKARFLVFESGKVPAPAMQAVKNMAELTASRPVPLIMVGNPLDEAMEKQRTALGITHVITPFDAAALVTAIKSTIEKAEAARQESEQRKAKQIQIRQRLKSASDKYATMTEEAARMKLNPPPEPEPEPEPASDEPAVEPVDEKLPDKPTWDGG